MPLVELLRLIGPYYDIILVEGHKDTPLSQKVWLCSDDGEDPPPQATGIRRVLRREDDRIEITKRMIDAWLPDAWRGAPVYAGILIGGRSARLGRPKHLEKGDGRTWLEETVDAVRSHVADVVILGGGDIPVSLSAMTVLPDVPGVSGPLAGMRAAVRWHPAASWVFVPCDLPLLREDAVQWLLGHREPGVWAVLPRLPDAPAPEPLLAYYDFRAAPLLEQAARPADVGSQGHVLTPVIPERFRASWTNVNTVDELAAAQSCIASRS